MKVRRMVIVGVFVLAVALVPMLAQAEEPTPTPTPTPSGLQPSVITGELAEPAFWLTLLLTLVAGAIGGVVYELLILQGNIERPHKLTEKEVAEGFPYAMVGYLFDLGIWARVIIGALAAVAALLVLSPPTAFGLLATAVVAGSAGTSVFRSLQDRLTAAMAQRDTAETKNDARALAAKVDETARAFEALKGKVLRASTSPAGLTTLQFESGAALDMGDLTQVERLLSQAAGMQERMQR